MFFFASTHQRFAPQRALAPAQNGARTLPWVRLAARNAHSDIPRGQECTPAVVPGLVGTSRSRAEALEALKLILRVNYMHCMVKVCTAQYTVQQRFYTASPSKWSENDSCRRYDGRNRSQRRPQRPGVPMPSSRNQRGRPSGRHCRQSLKNPFSAKSVTLPRLGGHPCMHAEMS